MGIGDASGSSATIGKMPARLKPSIVVQFAPDSSFHMGNEPFVELDL